MKYPIIESMTRINLTTGIFRIWRNEEELKDEYNNQDLFDCVYALPPVLSRDKIAEALAAMPRVNAVEVTDPWRGEGLVIYTNWP